VHPTNVIHSKLLEVAGLCFANFSEPPGTTQTTTGGPCVPGPKCKPGFQLVNGKCEPIPPDTDVDVRVQTIIKNVNNKVYESVSNHGHENYPNIDIIGLSTKSSGEAIVCLMNIASSEIQCQEFGMPSDRVAGAFWRVIETDHNKDYDNGNTGSSTIDDAITFIKNQQFDELNDLENNNFGIDLIWFAINPQGEGVACLSQDTTGVGQSLCEPFKVSSQEISGQITEGVAID
jgi:hypothetical protein